MSIYYKVGSRWTTHASWPTTIGNERRDLCQPGELAFATNVLFLFNLMAMKSIIFLHPLNHGLVFIPANVCSSILPCGCFAFCKHQPFLKIETLSLYQPLPSNSLITPKIICSPFSHIFLHFLYPVPFFSFLFSLIHFLFTGSVSFYSSPTSLLAL